MAYRQLTCVILFVFLVIMRTAAQDSSQRVTLPVFTGASFFYDFPQSFGATAGAELPISSHHISIVGKRGQKEKYRDLLAKSDVGFYRYSFNHTGLFLLQSIGYRYRKAKPYYFEWLATVGALRTFYDGTVYSVSNNGEVTKLPHFGRLYAITGITTVFGHDFEKSRKPQPFSVSLQPSLWVQYPYNSFVLPHFSLQLSLSYYFRNLDVSVRQKQTNRIHTS